MPKKDFDVHKPGERVGGIPRGHRNFYNKPQSFKKKETKRRKKVGRKDPFADWTKRRDIADPFRFARFTRGQVENMAPKNATDIAYLEGSKRKAVARSQALKKKLNETEQSWMPGMPEFNHNQWYQNIKSIEREYRWWINSVRNIARDIALARTFLH